VLLVSYFDSLREDIAGIGSAITDHADAQGRMNAAIGNELGKLWDGQAELRDELHALANRLEALTSFVVVDPAEVASKIVTLRQAPDA
jgi:hypothetical protein